MPPFQVFRSIKFAKLHEQSRQAEIERIEQEMLAARSSRGSGRGASKLRGAAMAARASSPTASLATRLSAAVAMAAAARARASLEAGTATGEGLEGGPSREPSPQAQPPVQDAAMEPGAQAAPGLPRQPSGSRPTRVRVSVSLAVSPLSDLGADSLPDTLSPMLNPMLDGAGSSTPAAASLARNAASPSPLRGAGSPLLPTRSGRRLVKPPPPPLGQCP